MTTTVNAHLDRAAVAAPSTEARAFHAALPGYAPTPVRDLPATAQQLGLGAVGVKDESARLGLPAFKVLGASWAVERTLRSRADTRTLVAASAGNHGRAVAHVAAQRGLRARIHLPARAVAARRQAIADEGAEVVVVDGDYEDAVRAASRAAREPHAAEIADVGASDQAHWVIDGYATLFGELTADWDVLLVPTGVGALAAAACRHAAAAGAAVVAVEPATAACLTASLGQGRPTRVATPGTVMAGLDCAEVSSAAWPTLLAGVAATITVADGELPDADRVLRAAGMTIGASGACTVAALHTLAGSDAARRLRDALALTPDSRVLLLATEGPTG